MSELIHIDNWDAIKPKLYEKWNHRNSGLCDDGGLPLEFKNFVEMSYTRVFRWNTFGSDSEELDIIGYDDELALDIIESLSKPWLESYHDFDRYVYFEYMDYLNSIIVEWGMRI